MRSGIHWQRSSWRTALVVAVGLLLTIALAACGSGTATPSGSALGGPLVDHGTGTPQADQSRDASPTVAGGDTGATQPTGSPAPSSYAGAYGGLDIQQGEIAAVGKPEQDGGTWYLVTDSGRIRLDGYSQPSNPPQDMPGTIVPSMPVEPMPTADCPTIAPDAPTANDGSTANSTCAAPAPAGTPEASGGSAGATGSGTASPVYCRPASDDIVAVGPWSLDGGTLVIKVRYSQPWGSYVCTYPSPVPPGPTPTPDTSVGAFYGHVDVGPLCPVEPCTQPTPSNMFDGKTLVLEPPGGGTTTIVNLTPDGWFKEMLPVGTYKLTMPDCPWLGCSRTFPMDVPINWGNPQEMTISIDTGIR